MKIIIYLLILSTFNNCAWNDKFRNSSPEGEDLVEVFDLKEKDFEKFKVSERKEDSKESEKKEKTKVVKKVESKKKKSKKKISEVKPEKVEKSPYPKDYPEKLKEYDKKFKWVWKESKPLHFVGEKQILSVSFLGITAGYVTMEARPIVSLGEKEAYHFKASLRSAEYYKFIYSLDDSVDSFVDIETNLPIKYTLKQRESGQKVDDLQLFDQKKLVTHYLYNRIKKGKNKKENKTTFIPKYFQDSFSVLYFARGLPLVDNKEYSFPVVTRAKLWIAKIEKMGNEKVSVMGTEIDAIKVRAETHYPGVLKKKGDIVFWFSNDDKRLLLKFEAKVKIGYVTGVIMEYVPGKD